MRTRKSPISVPPRLERDGKTPSGSGFRFRRQEHLKRRVEITRVFKKGRTVSYSGARLFFLVNGLPHNRMVITFARKYGNAVERNRARRVHREAYRLMKGRLAAGYDLVLLMYPETNQAMGLAEGAGRLEILFKKAGIR